MKTPEKDIHNENKNPGNEVNSTGAGAIPLRWIDAISQVLHLGHKSYRNRPGNSDENRQRVLFSMLERALEKNLKIHRKNTGVSAFFTTKYLRSEKKVLITESIADAIIESLRFSVDFGPVRLAAFVIMPGHWHALLAVLPPWTFPGIMNSIDTWIEKQSTLALELKGTSWQNGYKNTGIQSKKHFNMSATTLNPTPFDPD